VIAFRSRGSAACAWNPVVVEMYDADKCGFSCHLSINQRRAQAFGMQSTFSNKYHLILEVCILSQRQICEQ
jgi:hypothetical protein